LRNSDRQEEGAVAMTLPVTPDQRRAIMRRVFAMLGTVFLLLGVAGYAVAGAFVLIENGSGRSAKADGVIVKADYRALIQFTTASGQQVQFRNSVNSTSNTEGDHVPVVYDPAKPQEAAVDAFAGRWFFPGLFGIIASPFLLVGLSFAIVARFQRQRLPRDLAA
jgi:hypothetical protein